MASCMAPFYNHVPSCIDSTYSNDDLGSLINDAESKFFKLCLQNKKNFDHSSHLRLCIFAKLDIIPVEELRYEYGVNDFPWRPVMHADTTHRAKGTSELGREEMDVPPS